MKQTPIKHIDAKGLRQAVTTVAIAGALAGWAVLARPEAPVAVTTTTSIVAPAAQSAAPAVASAAQPAGGVTAAPSTLRVVTAPAPVTTTRSSR